MLKTAFTSLPLKIGRGNYDAAIDISSSDEIGQLASSFKKMARILFMTTSVMITRILII